MAWLAMLLAVFLDAALRPFWPEFLGLHRAPPDLPLLVALYVGLRARERGALFLAAALGAMKDCMSAWPLGHFAFVYGVAALLAHRARSLFPVDAPAGEAAATLAVSVATALVAFALRALAARPGGDALGLALLGSLATAAAASPAFALLDRSRAFRRALGRRRYEFAA